jgi:hypothetical protein
LSLEFGDVNGVGKWPVGLVVDFILEVRMPRFKSLDTVFRRHRQFSLLLSGNRPKRKKCYACPGILQVCFASGLWPWWKTGVKVLTP